MSIEKVLMQIDDPELQDLARKAVEISRRAYARHSKFKVGAALKTKADGVFVGCNVENDSYGLTSCAERNAVFAAVAAEGPAMRIAKIAVYARAESVPPCGACRQVLNQFGRTATIAFLEEGQFRAGKVKDLLPHEFRLKKRPKPKKRQ